MPLTRVIALDCGAGHAALGVFTRNATGRLRIEQFAHEHFLVEIGREEEWLPKITAAFARLRARLPVHGPVVMTLPAHATLAKLIKTPRVELAKRARIIQFEAQQNIPYALADVVWDSVLIGESALDLEVLLCAAKLEIVDGLCAAAEAAGFTPRVLVPSLLATLAGYRHAQPTDAPATLVVNLGARSSSLLLDEGRRFHARAFALGGHNATQQIAQSQDCEFASAEKLKLAERHAALVEPAAEAFAVRLAQEITRSVLHFQRQSAAPNPGRVLLTGGSARLPRLPETLSERLNVPVDRLDVLGAVEIGQAAARDEVAAHALTLADLVGAAAIQLRPGQPIVNLLPARLRTRETLRRRQPWLAAAAALAVASVLPPWWHYHEVAATARAKTAAIERELAPLREREARNRSNLQKLEAVRAQLVQLQALHDRRAAWVGLLSDLQARLVQVEDVWLERMQPAPLPPPAVTAARPAVPTVAATPGPLRVVVSGRMLDKTNPLSKVSDDTYRRVKELLAGIVDSPYVAAVENERFDHSQPGILRFDFVLVGQPARPL